MLKYNNWSLFTAVPLFALCFLIRPCVQYPAPTTNPPSRPTVIPTNIPTSSPADMVYINMQKPIGVTYRDVHSTAVGGQPRELTAFIHFLPAFTFTKVRTMPAAITHQHIVTADITKGKIPKMSTMLPTVKVLTPPYSGRKSEYIGTPPVTLVTLPGQKPSRAKPTAIVDKTKAAKTSNLQHSNEDLYCTFEPTQPIEDYPFCSLKSDHSSDSSRWILQKAGTGVGPALDHTYLTNGPGHYLYIQNNERTAAEGRLTTFHINGDETRVCIRASCILYGSGVSLNISVEANKKVFDVWGGFGDDNDDPTASVWQTVSPTATMSSFFVVVFLVSFSAVDTSSLRYIAIDDLIISKCPP